MDPFDRELPHAMPDLRAIAYVSSATRLLSVAELEALLVTARDLNLQSSVTGVLLYGSGIFMQCFEGPPPAVHETYERIRASRQHMNIIELLNEPINVRGFADWQMGFSQVTPSELLTLSNARWERLNADVRGRWPTSSGLALLQNFWKHTRK